MAHDKAKFRLKSAHYLTGDIHLPGDTETADRGEEQGTVVGHGTKYSISWPTFEMEPLNDDARDWLAEEEERLNINQGSMNPIEDLPLDQYEQNYVPGLNIKRKHVPDGAPVKK